MLLVDLKKLQKIGFDEINHSFLENIVARKMLSLATLQVENNFY